MIIKKASLTPKILEWMTTSGTEEPFTGHYTDWDQPGTYLCPNCGIALFRSQAKFHSGCGWPSFDREIDNAVENKPDPDGRRVEILCARCHMHLGHVFTGEGYTEKNLRHCVNSYALDFVPDLTINDTEEAIYAAGCFWGVEHLFKKLPGVLKTEVGYSGGHKTHPSYQEVCQGDTGQFEAIRIVYDPTKISYEDLTRYFFEIHDPTQKNGQGPDLGTQYLSVAFYYNDEQKQTAEALIKTLESNNYKVATQVLPVSTFWPAEDYHQNYYEKTGKNPYCHYYTKRF